MKIDIEALIAAKQEERQARIQRIEESERERQQRRVKRAQQDAEQYEQDLRRHATKISECFGGEYSPNLLHNWFLLDHWTVQQALILLCGYDANHVPHDQEGRVSVPVFLDEELWETDRWKLPSDEAARRIGLIRIRRLDGLQLFGPFTVQILGTSRVGSIALDFKLMHGQLLRIWNSGTHVELRYPPKYFIDWAVSKKLSIDWLEWAEAEGYYGEPPAHDASIGKDVSPKSEAAYLNIIGALGELYWAAAHPGQEYSQAALLAALKSYEGFTGMSERNLKDKLTKAMRAVRE